MQPYLEGCAERLTNSLQHCCTGLATTLYGLTFVNYTDMVASTTATATNNSVAFDGLHYMPMYNRASFLVEPLINSTQLAMCNFKNYFANNNLMVDIINAPGNDLWPIVYLILVLMGTQMTIDNCNVVMVMLQFITWLHTNELAMEAILNLLFTPLDNNLKKCMLNSLGVVNCSNALAYTMGLIIGYSIPSCWARPGPLCGPQQ